jgi:hypothetical protein
VGLRALNLATTLETYDFVFSGDTHTAGSNVEVDTKEIVETLQGSRMGQKLYEVTVKGQNVTLWYGSTEEDENREGWFLKVKNRIYLAPGFKNNPDWKAVGRILEERGFSRRD